MFFNKRRDRLKLLWHDRTGWCLLYKALDRGFFRIPEAGPEAKTGIMETWRLSCESERSR